MQKGIVTAEQETSSHDILIFNGFPTASLSPTVYGFETIEAFAMTSSTVKSFHNRSTKSTLRLALSQMSSAIRDISSHQLLGFFPCMQELTSY